MNERDAMERKNLPKEQVIHAFSPDLAAALSVLPGEVFRLETEDCYGGALKSAADSLPGDGQYRGNPATGPVRIVGARPGDTLKIKVLDIQLRDYAVTRVRPGAGALKGFIEHEEVAIYPIRDGELIFGHGRAFPVSPMIGVIGVAPASGPVSTLLPGEHGGNLDCKLIVKGSVICLPVAVEGALLAVGDLHAAMGDGEVCVCGAEVAGMVTLSAEILAGDLAPTPRVETAMDISFLASAETLDGAEKKVLEKAFRFLTEMWGLRPNDAARYMGLVGDLAVCQVVNPLKTLRFTLPI